MCGVFSKDGREFYYNAEHEGRWTIFYTMETGNKWIIVLVDQLFQCKTK